MHFVVTGAGGFIGGRVAQHLFAAGHTVTACYRRNLGDALRQAAGIALVRGDLADGIALPDRFDVLVHCAADIPGLCPDQDSLVRSNVMGARTVFRAARDAGARVIVNLSSMSAYGTISVPVISEDEPPDEPDAYGQSKLDAERDLEGLCEASTDLTGLSIRLPGVVGRGSHHNFLSSVMTRINEGAPVSANNPEALFNNIIYVDDLAVFIRQWAELPKVQHAVTNVAADEAITIGDLLTCLYSCMDRTPEVRFTTGGKTPFLISLDKAKSIGFRPATVRASIASFAADVLSVSTPSLQATERHG